MTHPRPSIASLRASLAQPETARPVEQALLGHGPADLALNGGLRRGALHEVFAGAGHEGAATGFAAGLALRLAQGKAVLWITQDFATSEFGTPCAPGLMDFGLEPARVLSLCVTNAQDALRAANDALGCNSLGVVLVEIAGNPKSLALSASRKLVLSCARHAVPAILLRLGASDCTSAAETRWLAQAAPSARHEDQWGHPVFHVRLTRNRHGQTGDFVFAWSYEDGCFSDVSADTGLVVSPPGDRQVEAA